MSKAWAQTILNSNAVILDTETTGGRKTSQVIQLSIIDTTGETLFNSLLRPTCEIEPMAETVHHISKYHLRSAPTLPDVIEQVRGVLDGRVVIAYNSSFDRRMMGQTMQAFNLDKAWFEQLDWQCAMRAYAEYLGVKNAPKLEGGDHSAKGDCLATLDLLRKMAGRVDKNEVETLKEVESRTDICQIVTVPAPPLRFVSWALATLRKRAATGDYPPAGWIESLEVIEQALKANEAAQLEIIGQTPIAQVAAINPAGVDITAFVGSTVTTDVLMMLHNQTTVRYGDSWQLFAEPVDRDTFIDLPCSNRDVMWRVTGVKCLPSPS